MQWNVTYTPIMVLYDLKLYTFYRHNQAIQAPESQGLTHTHTSCFLDVLLQEHADQVWQAGMHTAHSEPRHIPGSEHQFPSLCSCLVSQACCNRCAVALELQECQCALTATSVQKLSRMMQCRVSRSKDILQQRRIAHLLQELIRSATFKMQLNMADLSAKSASTYVKGCMQQLSSSHALNRLHSSFNKL